MEAVSAPPTAVAPEMQKAVSEMLDKMALLGEDVVMPVEERNQKLGDLSRQVNAALNSVQPRTSRRCELPNAQQLTCY